MAQPLFHDSRFFCTRSPAMDSHKLAGIGIGMKTCCGARANQRCAPDHGARRRALVLSPGPLNGAPILPIQATHSSDCCATGWDIAQTASAVRFGTSSFLKIRFRYSFTVPSVRCNS